MRDGQIHNVNYLETRRRELRSHLTPAEATLWRMLKSKALKGRKFRRQHSIERFVVDFYCPSERLIIELDGAVHNDPIQSKYDEERSERLRELGNRILRFENKLIFTNSVEVLNEIARHFNEE